MSSKHLGVYYHHADGTDCFIAYNMHEEEQTFALPALRKGKDWYLVVTTEEEQIGEEKVVNNQREATLSGRTIHMYIGK